MAPCGSPAGTARARGRHEPTPARACAAWHTGASRSPAEASDLLALDDPKGPVGAFEALGALDLAVARELHADPLPVTLENGPWLTDRRHEAPGTHLAVHVCCAVGDVDPPIRVL